VCGIRCREKCGLEKCQDLGKGLKGEAKSLFVHGCIASKEANCAKVCKRLKNEEKKECMEPCMNGRKESKKVRLFSRS